ncbi:diguanylate cyclase domain-containing protein [Noviherbaspirillum sp. ST9]|uniref:sensor domain-containing protein n=1 Tax=Noviherbaspirillum sp. ST9 TaxID=3401606 RepID=UPI003B58A7E5
MNDQSIPFDHTDARSANGDFHFLAYPSHILVWTCDATGACDFVSPSWLEFTGRDMPHEMGWRWHDRVHPEDRGTVARGLEEAIAGRQPFRLLYRYQRADGAYRWFVNQGMVRLDASGELAGYVGQCFDVTAYQEGEAELEHSAQRMITLLRQTRLIAVVLDTEGRVMYSNGSVCRLLSVSGSELMNCRLFERYLAPGGRALLDRIYPDGGRHAVFAAEFEAEMCASDGGSRHVLWHAIVLHEYSGKVRGTILIGDDLTEARRMEQQLSLTASVFESTSQAIVVTDAEARIISVNQAFSDLTGYSRDEAIGQNPRLLKSGRHDHAFYEQMWKTIRETGHWRGDVWDRRKDGSVYPKFLSICAIRNDGGEVTNYAGIFYEISERKAVEERLDFLAHYDTLTGLPNRCLLLDRLKLSVQRALREGTKVGLLYLDLDHFKEINDTFGHAAGDDVLKAAALRMQGCVRAADTVARLGGDEFVVMLPDIKKLAAAEQVAKKIQVSLSQPYNVDGHETLALPSVGISIFPDDHHDEEVLLKQADAAMYEAKQLRSGAYRFYRDIGDTR